MQARKQATFCNCSRKCDAHRFNAPGSPRNVLPVVVVSVCVSPRSLTRGSARDPCFKLERALPENNTTQAPIHLRGRAGLLTFAVWIGERKLFRCGGKGSRLRQIGQHAAAGHYILAIRLESRETFRDAALRWITPSRAPRANSDSARRSMVAAASFSPAAIAVSTLTTKVRTRLIRWRFTAVLRAVWRTLLRACRLLAMSLHPLNERRLIPVAAGAVNSGNPRSLGPPPSRRRQLRNQSLCESADSSRAQRWQRPQK